MMDLMIQQLVPGLPDLSGDADLPGWGELKKRLEKLGFLLSGQIGSAPLAELRPFYRLRTESVVPGYDVVYRGNGNTRMNSDLPGRTRVYQGVPNHQPPAILSSPRLLEPY